MQAFYPVVFTKEETGYSTSAVDLEGCFSEGDTFEEAYANILDAIGLYLEDSAEMPSGSDPASVPLESGQFVCVVAFDPLDYKRRMKTKSVKKTLTIPSWLNEEAERRHINFSGVLKEALLARLDL